MFIVFILYFDVIVFAYCPVEIYCSFIVSLYAQSLSLQVQGIRRLQ